MAKTLADHMNDHAQARCDINILYGVIAILEGGTISADSYRDVQRIIAICKSASGKSLRRMDKAIAYATRGDSSSATGSKT